jgi:Asp-tRNA(Asn)/Glu-tRNA(Gln) amidotransferase A subunit family amidase
VIDIDPFATATELLAAPRAGRVTSLELTDLYIRRIGATTRASTRSWSATSTAPAIRPARADRAAARASPARSSASR